MSATLFREHCRLVCLCLVQEEMVKMGFCHKSVRKQQVWLLRNRGSCVRDAGSDADGEF